MTLITSGSDWTFDNIETMAHEIEVVGKELGLDWYTNQIEIINSEQMMDCYSAIGMPLMYKHWSFGKSFLQTQSNYRNHRQGLAYEIVINSNPCVVFCMENNSMLMQALVIAHAGIGHNHFFKNNELFKEWTQADNILPYLEYAKKFIDTCEEKYGSDAVEELIDIAHSLMDVSHFKYPRKERPTLKQEMERKIHQALENENEFNDLWRTVPKGVKTTKKEKKAASRKAKYNLPEENLLFFLENNSPILKPWQRELLRIVRNIGQYFYPQSQTKTMNEGCATYVHYTIINRLYEKGLLTEGSMLEFIKSHTSVVFQPGFDDPHYSGINPYALGFAMMQDIERICNEPTEEDFKWFPDLAGTGNHMEALKYAWANFRDESFIRQYLSPKVMRDFRLFTILNKENEQSMVVENIHNDAGYRKVRSKLADSMSMDDHPQIEVVDVNLDENRELEIQFLSKHGHRLHRDDATLCLINIAKLWGYTVTLSTVDVNNREIYLRDSQDCDFEYKVVDD